MLYGLNIRSLFRVSKNHNCLIQLRLCFQGIVQNRATADLLAEMLTQLSPMTKPCWLGNVLRFSACCSSVVRLIKRAFLLLYLGAILVRWYAPSYPTSSFGLAVNLKVLLRTDKMILLNTGTMSQSSHPIISKQPESPVSSNPNKQHMTSPVPSTYCEVWVTIVSGWIMWNIYQRWPIEMSTSLKVDIIQSGVWWIISFRMVP